MRSSDGLTDKGGSAVMCWNDEFLTFRFLNIRSRRSDTTPGTDFCISKTPGNAGDQKSFSDE